MKTFIVKVNIEKEIQAEDDEDAINSFFQTIEEDNSTIENLVGDNIIAIDKDYIR